MILSISENEIGIIGIGSFLPEKVLTNFDLEKMVDTNDEWIMRRTGISERRILREDTPSYTMGIEASKKAIADAGITAEDIDLIIVTTNSPDSLSPTTSCVIQGNIGAKNAVAFDMNAACSGFVFGLSTAKQFIMSGTYKHVLVVGCEGMSKITDWEDRNTCILFGDAAGAVVVGKVEKGYGIIDTYLGSDGTQGECITVPCSYIDEKEKEKRPGIKKQTLWMDGGIVLKFAVKILAHATETLLNKCGMSIEDINFIVPHQANIRIIEGAVKKLCIDKSKVIVNLHKYGNVSSASIPVALDEAYKAGKFKKGDCIILVGFGGGLTWASALLKWNK